jgi:hypothetical protein
MTDLADKLRTLAEDAPPSRPHASFSVRHRERSIRVSFNTDKNHRITALTLNVGYDASAAAANVNRIGEARGGYRDPASAPLVATRPLSIILRPENAADTAAKREGVASEWASGDRQFDDAIYVSSPKHESDLFAHVLNQDVRAGAVELLMNLGFESIEIDDANGHVSTKTSVGVRPGGEEDKKREEDKDDRSARVLEAFERIVANLPKVTASGKKHAGRPLAGCSWILLVIGAGGWLGSIPFFSAFTKLLRQVRDGGKFSSSQYDLAWLAILVAFVVAIISGIAGAKFYGRIIEARVRGTSEAHTEISSAKTRAFLGFSVIAFIITYTLMFMFATSPPVAH